MQSKVTVSIASTLRSVPFTHGARSIPFEKMARRIFPRSYELSLVLSGDTLARSLNKAHRGKEYPANVLSFPIGPNDGEIFLNVRKAEREARSLGIPLRERTAHLFVHGCLHLTGYGHGNAMERREKHILREFGFQKSKK